MVSEKTIEYKYCPQCKSDKLIVLIESLQTNHGHLICSNCNYFIASIKNPSITISPINREQTISVKINTYYNKNNIKLSPIIRIFEDNHLSENIGYKKY